MYVPLLLEFESYAARMQKREGDKPLINNVNVDMEVRDGTRLPSFLLFVVNCSSRRGKT